MFKHVVFDICSKCNALCKWCYTGEKNRKGIKSGGALDFELFKKAVSYMREKKIIAPDSIFFIYNWGESFLNPEFKKFVNYFNENDIEYIISTNASKVVSFDGPNDLRKLRAIVFSMPGFSQGSYEKIHGFDFEQIKTNIQMMLENYRAHGFKGKAEIRYHVYQFNLDEIPLMMDFAKEHSICVSPTYAGIADLKRLMQYLSSQMTYEELKEISQELILPYIDDVSKQMPQDYKCPYYDALLIDDRCNILTCCMVTEEMDGYSIGNLFDLDIDKMKELKVTQPVCKKCMDLAVPFIINNRPYPKMIEELDLKYYSSSSKSGVYIWGTEYMGRKVAEILEEQGLAVQGFIFSSVNNNDIAEVNGKRIYSIEEILNENEIPFIIVADEHMYEKVDLLKARGLIMGKDFITSNIVRRDY